MPSVFQVGAISASAKRKGILYVDPRRPAIEIEKLLKNDQVVQMLGYRAQWDENCVLPSDLESWRHQGDDECDYVVRFLDLGPGKDGLQALQTYITDTPTEETDPRIKAFWKSITRYPPSEVTACTASEEAFCSETILKRNYYPQPVLSEGQAVFWRYCGTILSSLLHFSLAGGFSAPRLVKVLQETNYLTSQDKDRTYRRLLETSQMVIDAMNDMTPLTGIGWQSVIRVRMLHSQTRIRILDGKGMSKSYDLSQDGIPINQEDLAATLGSFSLAPLICLRKRHFGLSYEEEAAYLSAWRHIGYYLGISPTLLEKHFNGHSSAQIVQNSSKLFLSLLLHLFCGYPDGSPDMLSTSYKILHAVAERPPGRSSLEYHCEVSRAYLGDELATHCGIPKGSLKKRLLVLRNNWIFATLAHFSRHYPLSGWSTRYLLLSKRFTTALLLNQLGNKRTKFTGKKVEDGNADPSGDSQSVRVNSLGRLREESNREFYKLVAEFLGVVVVTGGVVFLAVWRIVAYYRA